MSKILSKGLTFDDVLLVPAYSEVTPDVVDVTAWLTPSISLNIPLVSAAMDTVTESAMAISMARAGGIGIVHKNMSIERQKLEIEKVKKSESGMIIDPITVEPDDTVEHALDLMHAYRVSGLPVVREKKLVGILTNRDVRFVEDLAGTKVRDVMTSENLITVPTGTTLEEAKHHLHTHRIEKLLVVDEKGELAGLLTMKDIDKVQKYPAACKDDKGRLRVGAAIGVGKDCEYRASELLAAGADMNRVLCLTADDYFQRTGQPLTLKDEALAKFAAKAGPLLLIVDPLQSFLPSDVEMASRNQMRSALLPLRAIASKQGCAVLIVMHSNKKQGVSGRARLADSSDIWDMARSVLMMGRAKNDGKIYLSHEKSSYARPQQTVLLHIDDVEVEGVKTARAVFDGYTDKKDADFIEERRVRTAETRQDPRSAILNVLSESRLGSMANPQLKSAVLQEIKCSEATYKRSYAELVRDGDIAKYQLCQKDGARGWFTRLAYRGEIHDTVRNI